MGEILMNELRTLPNNIVSVVRGKGLLCAIVISPSQFTLKYLLKNDTWREVWVMMLLRNNLQHQGSREKVDRKDQP